MVLNDSGDEVQDHVGIVNVFSNYFTTLFTSSYPIMVNEVVDFCNSKVSSDNKAFLSTTFTKEEVYVAVKETSPDGAPSLDGVNMGFQQKHWNIVGSDVTMGVLDMLNNDALVSDINHTNIVFIPKKKGICSTEDFRLISFCNVLYKFIAKVLVNRIRIVLDSVISEQHNAFIPNQKIYDNVIVAQKIIHALRKKKFGTYSSGMDLFGLYYEKMEFSDSFVGLIITCITSVNYSIVVNGNTSGNIVPSRSFLQGDPLSPYLFLLCGEDRSSLIFRAKGDKSFHGLKASRVGPSSFHLLFFDDSMIFYRSTIDDLVWLNQFFIYLKMLSVYKLTLVNFLLCLVLIQVKLVDDIVRTFLVWIKSCRMINICVFLCSLGGPRSLFF